MQHELQSVKPYLQTSVWLRD